jgi:NhaP-type Na+/H+ or K+/H+ antiporter
LLTGGFIGIFLAKGDSGLVAADVGKVFALNILLLIIRFMVLGIWWPLVNLVGYKISWKEYILMSYSGLRGAIGLAIALLVYLNTAYDEYFRDFTILSISSVILFTVLVQGMTLKLIMKLVRYNQINKTKQKLYRDLLRRLFLSMLKKSETIRKVKQISALVHWSALYDIFNFPKFILKLENMITGNKPLMLDYNDETDLIGMGMTNLDKLDNLISDDEDEFDNPEDNHTEENKSEENRIRTETALTTMNNSKKEEIKETNISIGSIL